MAHNDLIIDSDGHFLIDPVTREITNQSDKNVLIQYDHNSERLTFEVDNIVEGHSLAECNRVEIHYINVATDKRSQVSDFYPVDDLKLENGKLTFSWLVSRNVTQLVGGVSFVVRFICMEGDTEVYSWGTAKSDVLEVAESINNAGLVNEDYSDIISQWYSMLVGSGTVGVNKVEEAKNNAIAEINEKKAEALNDLSFVKIKNIIPEDTEIVCGTINPQTGAFTTYSNASASNSKIYGLLNAKIPVKGGENIVISYTNTATGTRSSTGISLVAFYDENDLFISCLGSSPSVESQIFNADTPYITTPNNAKYLAVCYYANPYRVDGFSKYTEFQIEYGTQRTDYESPQNAYIPTEMLNMDAIRQILMVADNPLYGKKWCAIGDSITIRSGNYVGIIADELGMEATNLGISGAGCNIMRNSFTSETNQYYTEDRKNAVINADLITIYGCVNDWFKEVDGNKAYAIGDLYGDRSESTFINMFKNLVEAVLQLNPTAQIVIIGCHNSFDSSRPEIYHPVRGTDTIAEYVDAMHKVARYYGLYFVDMYHESGINEFTGDMYLVDGVHPNTLGYAQISKVLKRHLLSL